MNIAHIVQHPNTELLLMSELNKLKHQLVEVEQKLQQSRQFRNIKQLSVFASNHHRLVRPKDIIMIAAASNYSTIYLKNGDKLFTSKTLKHWEAECHSSDLARVHKSFLINKKMIQSIDVKSSEVILNTGLKVKYSRMSKSELLHLLAY